VKGDEEVQDDEGVLDRDGRWRLGWIGVLIPADGMFFDRDGAAFFGNPFGDELLVLEICRGVTGFR